MRFKATVESCGGKEFIGYVRILSRSHIKQVRTNLDVSTFAIDVNELGSIAGVEVFEPKKIFKKYRTQLALALEEMEKKTPPSVREELHEGLTKAFDWMEEQTKELAAFENRSYVYGSN